MTVAVAVAVVVAVVVVTPRALVGAVVGIDGHEAQRAQELGEFEAAVAVGVGFGEELVDVFVHGRFGLQRGQKPGAKISSGSHEASPSRA